LKHIIFLLAFSSFITNCSLAIEVDSIKIQTKSEGYLLNGILIKKLNHKGKMPVVLFLVGSGSSSSYKTNYKDFVQFFVEQTFLEKGYAIAYFDKRGVGTSQGIWYETTFNQRARDAKNIAVELQKFEFIDRSKIFLVGHSQGGWIVQIALSQYSEVFAGGVSLAGPTFGVKKQLINDYQSKLMCGKGYGESRSLRKAKRRVNRDLSIISILGRKGNLKQLKLIKNFEADQYLKSIGKPFLLVFGENDELVNLNWCLEELKKLFPNGLPASFETYVANDATHSLKIASKCYQGKSADIDYSTSTQQKIFGWIELHRNKK
jgi:hypothetical protein